MHPLRPHPRPGRARSPKHRPRTNPSLSAPPPPPPPSTTSPPPPATPTSAPPPPASPASAAPASTASTASPAAPAPALVPPSSPSLPSAMAGPIRTSPSTSAARNANTQPPRPPNAWILYRSDKLRELNRDPGNRKPQAEISKIISQWWKQESDDVRGQYEKLSEKKKLEHQLQYPGYRFQPIKKVDKDRQRAEKAAEKERAKALKGATKGKAPADPVDPRADAPSASSPSAEQQPSLFKPNYGFPPHSSHHDSHALPADEPISPTQPASAPLPPLSDPSLSFAPKHQMWHRHPSESHSPTTGSFSSWNEQALLGAWPSLEAGFTWPAPSGGSPTGSQVGDAPSWPAIDNQSPEGVWNGDNLIVSVPVTSESSTPPPDFSQAAPVQGTMFTTSDPYCFNLNLDSGLPASDASQAPEIDVVFGDWSFYVDPAQFWGTLTGPGQLDLPSISGPSFSPREDTSPVDHSFHRIDQESLVNNLSPGAGLLDYEGFTTGGADTLESLGLETPAASASLSSYHPSQFSTHPPLPSNDSPPYPTTSLPSLSSALQSAQHRTPYVPPAGAANNTTRRVGGSWSRPPLSPGVGLPPQVSEPHPAPWQSMYMHPYQPPDSASPPMSIPGLCPQPRR